MRLLPDSILSVLQCLEPSLCWFLVLHLVDGLLDIAQQVVDLLGSDELGFDREIVDVGVQDLHQKVEVL